MAANHFRPRYGRPLTQRWGTEMKFRKKPVVVNAWPVDELTQMPFSNSDLPQAIRDAANAGVYIHNGNGTATIRTLEGDHLASKGDWVIQGVAGELYQCKPDIFASTYERVQDAEVPDVPPLTEAEIRAFERVMWMFSPSTRKRIDEIGSRMTTNQKVAYVRKLLGSGLGPERGMF